MEIIPHRQPFMLLDTVEELTPGSRALAKKCVAYNEPYFQGHFPGEPVMPGVLIIEALAQAGAVFRAVFTRLEAEALLSKRITSYGLSKYDFLLLLLAFTVWLAVSVWEEKGKDVRAYLAGRPAILRWSWYYGVVLLLLITGIYGGSYDTAAFLYQSF